MQYNVMQVEIERHSHCMGSAHMLKILALWAFGRRPICTDAAAALIFNKAVPDPTPMNLAADNICSLFGPFVLFKDRVGGRI
jgi:hypothetical protein